MEGAKRGGKVGVLVSALGSRLSAVNTRHSLHSSVRRAIPILFFLRLSVVLEDGEVLARCGGATARLASSADVIGWSFNLFHSGQLHTLVNLIQRERHVGAGQ